MYIIVFICFNNQLIFFPFLLDSAGGQEPWSAVLSALALHVQYNYSKDSSVSDD
jgi:hypothetical protein